MATACLLTWRPSIRPHVRDRSAQAFPLASAGSACVHIQGTACWALDPRKLCRLSSASGSSGERWLCRCSSTRQPTSWQAVQVLQAKRPYLLASSGCAGIHGPPAELGQLREVGEGVLVGQGAVVAVQLDHAGPQEVDVRRTGGRHKLGVLHEAAVGALRRRSITLLPRASGVLGV